MPTKLRSIAFELDLQHNYVDELKIIAAILEQQPAIEKIRITWGPEARVPPRAPA